MTDVRQFSRQYMLLISKDAQTTSVTLTLINLMNGPLFFTVGILGTLANLFDFFAYIERKKKFVDKYFMPLRFVSNQLVIIAFVVSNSSFLFSSASFNLFKDHSFYVCGCLSLVFNVFSSLNNLIYGLYPVFLNLYAKKSWGTLKIIQICICLSPILLSSIYLLDFVNLESLSVRSNASEPVNVDEITCSTKDPRTNLLSGLIDMLVYFFVPFATLMASACTLGSKSEALSKIKMLVPLAFFITWFPVCLIILLRDYQLVTNKTQTDFSLELGFSIALFVNHCLPITASCIHALTNKHNLKVFYNISCFTCRKLKKFHQRRKLLQLDLTG